MPKKTNFTPDGDFTSKNVVFNKEQVIMRVNVADLKLRLNHFSSAVKKSSLQPALLGLIGLWLPIATSDFKGVFGLSSELVLGIYWAIAVGSTIYFIWNFTPIILFRTFKFLATKFPKIAPIKISSSYFFSHETDAEAFVDKLCNLVADDESVAIKE